MKKTNILLFLLLLVAGSNTNPLQAQTKFIDKNGSITFEASEELFEPVKAENNNVTMLLNIDTNEIAALALMKGFRFKNSLMEEHFNENFIESETYPKATFRGTLEGFSFSEVDEFESEYSIDGVLKLHGKEKKVVVPVRIKNVEGTLYINGSFSVTPEDFDIEIPKIVKNKIAKEIQVSINFKLASK